MADLLKIGQDILRDLRIQDDVFDKWCAESEIFTENRKSEYVSEGMSESDATKAAILDWFAREGVEIEIK